MSWHPIPGLPGYEASLDGRVRRLDGRELQTSLSDSGYLRVRPKVGQTRKSIMVQRAVALAFLGSPPSPRHQAAHLDGDRFHNHVRNLAWKTPEEQEEDKRRHGTQRNGAGRRVCARLVKSLVARGHSFSAVARRTGLHRSSVSRIARGLRRAS